MDFKKVKKMIEERRILTGFSSYPYIVNHENIRYVVWFNYDIPEEECIRIIVSDVFWINSDYEINTKRIEFEKTITVEEDKEPAIDYDEYLEKMKELYDRYSESEFQELISKTEDGIICSIYDEVTKLIF